MRPRIPEVAGLAALLLLLGGVLTLTTRLSTSGGVAAPTPSSPAGTAAELATPVPTAPPSPSPLSTPTPSPTPGPPVLPEQHENLGWLAEDCPRAPSHPFLPPDAGCLTVRHLDPDRDGVVAYFIIYVPMDQGATAKVVMASLDEDGREVDRSEYELVHSPRGLVAVFDVTEDGSIDTVVHHVGHISSGESYSVMSIDPVGHIQEHPDHPLEGIHVADIGEQQWGCPADGGDVRVVFVGSEFVRGSDEPAQEQDAWARTYEWVAPGSLALVDEHNERIDRDDGDAYFDRHLPPGQQLAAIPSGCVDNLPP